MHPHLYVAQTATGEIPVNTWGAMITIAFLVGVFIANGRARHVGIDPDKLTGFYMLAVGCGLAGARLLHFLMATPEVFFRDPMVFFRLWEGGFAFYGGFILATIASVIYARARGIDFWKLADATSPVVMLGLAFGRIGCFSAGCCHGMQVELPADAMGLFPASFEGGQLYLMAHPPFLVELTHHGVGLNDVPVIATQLYESLAAFLLFLFGTFLWKRRRFDGEVLAAMIVLYALWRPFNESLRGDEIRGTDWFGLTTSQLISIPMGVVGLLILLVQFRKGVKPETPFVLEDDLSSAPRL